MDAQTQEGLPATLLIGKNLGDLLLLAKGIYFRTISPENEALYDSLSKKALSLEAFDTIISEKYHLDTSYYHCDTKLILATYEHMFSYLDSENPDEFLEKQDISSVQSIIFVSNLKRDTATGVDNYLDHHKDLIEKYNPELTICFAHTEKVRGEELYETFKFGENELFVEVIDDNLDEVEVKKPHTNVKVDKFEEKEGIERVVENLECHMWPNMIQKPQQKRVIAENVPEEADDDEESEIVTKKTEEKPIEKKEEPVKVEEKVENKKEDEPKVNGKTDKPAEVNKLSKEADKKDKKKDDLEYFDDDEDDKGVDSLAKVLETVRQFKMDSKNLPDEQRREQATSLLMKLIANCPELQMDDSDEEGLDV